MGKEVIIDTQTIIEKRQSIGKSEHKGFFFFFSFFSRPVRNNKRRSAESARLIMSNIIRITCIAYLLITFGTFIKSGWFNIFLVTNNTFK